MESPQQRLAMESPQRTGWVLKRSEWLKSWNARELTLVPRADDGTAARLFWQGGTRSGSVAVDEKTTVKLVDSETLELRSSDRVLLLRSAGEGEGTAAEWLQSVEAVITGTSVPAAAAPASAATLDVAADEAASKVRALENQLAMVEGQKVAEAALRAAEIQYLRERLEAAEEAAGRANGLEGHVGQIAGQMEAQAQAAMERAEAAEAKILSLSSQLQETESALTSAERGAQAAQARATVVEEKLSNAHAERLAAAAKAEQAEQAALAAAAKAEEARAAELAALAAAKVEAAKVEAAKVEAAKVASQAAGSPLLYLQTPSPSRTLADGVVEDTEGEGGGAQADEERSAWSGSDDDEMEASGGPSSSAMFAEAHLRDARAASTAEYPEWLQGASQALESAPASWSAGIDQAAAEAEARRAAAAEEGKAAAEARATKLSDELERLRLERAALLAARPPLSPAREEERGMIDVVGVRDGEGAALTEQLLQVVGSDRDDGETVTLLDADNGEVSRSWAASQMSEIVQQAEALCVWLHASTAANASGMSDRRRRKSLIGTMGENLRRLSVAAGPSAAKKPPSPGVAPAAGGRASDGGGELTKLYLVFGSVERATELKERLEGARERCLAAAANGNGNGE